MVGLTEDDIERIQHFVNTPRYEREPDHLLPEDETEDIEEPEE